MKKLKSVGVSYTEGDETKYINVNCIDLLSDYHNKYYMQHMETYIKDIEADVASVKRLNEIAELEARLDELKSQMSSENSQ